MEQLRGRIRVKEMYMSDPIASAEALSSAEWADQLPLTLRDDEVLISEEDAEEDELYSHENDIPEESEFTGRGLSITGSFIKATREQLVQLAGGEVQNEMYAHPSTKLQLEKSLKLVCHDGSTVIIPRAKGYVNVSMSLGKGGVTKNPFKFKLLRASSTWDCDLLY